jgi:hypothetical protein
MTEAEWAACAEPKTMLSFLRGAVSARRLRLFACACCRRAWRLLADERSRKAVEVAERYADGSANEEELEAASADALAAVEAAEARYKTTQGWQAAWAAHADWNASEAAVRTSSRELPFSPSEGWGVDDVIEWVLDVLQAAARDTARAAGASDPEAWAAAEARERAGQALLVRDVFGNPFQPRHFLDAAWLTWNRGTVRNIAQAIYQGHAFDGLPVLADALEDAGCKEERILAHCRSGGAHVRGCFVVDLLLAKK